MIESFVLFAIIMIILMISFALIESKRKSTRSIGYIGLGVCIICYVITSYLTGNIKLYELLLNPFSIMILIYVILGVVINLYTLIRNLKAKNHDNEIVRNINVKYPPSIASYLLTQNISYKDLMADIMNLYAKKVIDVNKNNDKIIFHLNDSNTKANINKSENYIIETLIENKDNKKFDFDEWKKYVHSEYEKYGFSNMYFEKCLKFVDDKFYFFLVAIGIIVAIIFFILTKMVLMILAGLILGMTLGLFILCPLLSVMGERSNLDVFLNKKGKRELEKLIGIKEFINEYTLIKERSFEEIILYESYIPYAISLGINTKYKDTKFDIFEIEEMESIIDRNKVTTLLERLGMCI